MYSGIKMSRVTKTIGFSVPPSMAEEFDSIALEERRTKSELFREMLRLYQTYRKQAAQVEAERLGQVAQQGSRAGKGASGR
jgi:metal-responsive CopG/Arc/MetJ family transcriptional regulator